LAQNEVIINDLYYFSLILQPNLERKTETNKFTKKKTKRKGTIKIQMSAYDYKPSGTRQGLMDLDRFGWI
jgi:hypothetical protein